MRKLLRFVAIVGAGAVILALATGGSVAIGSGVLGSFSSAKASPLPPLSVPTGEPSVIYAADGTTVLAVERGSVNRLPVGSLSDVAPVMQNAVLDTEDARFYQHGGFDIPSTIRALRSDTSAGGGLQGGSTLAQQLVKQLYLTSARSLTRKVKEAVLADRLEKHYSKQQIFTAYLNTIYLGNGAYGVKAAAEQYFNEEPSQITLPQAALLAGLIQNPSGYDPIGHPVEARDRRAHVLSRMVHYHTISQAQADQAALTPLPTAVNRPQTSSTIVADGFYVDQVKNFLLNSPRSPLGKTYSERYDALFEGGLHIITNLDPREQGLADSAVNGVINSVGAPHGDVGAMVAIEPTTGKVRAVVGGPSYSKPNQFDLATDAHRQAGSGFKVFSLLAAYQQGFSPNDTIDGTGPCDINYPGFGHTGVVSNAEPGGGTMTVQAATANSVNCAFMRLGSQVGLANIVHQANLLGLPETFKNFGTNHQCPNYCPSLVIGGSEGVTVLEMANAYATIDDNGVYHAPSFVDRIINANGKTTYIGQQPGKQVIPVDVDHEVLADLQAVVQGGTGTPAQLGAQPAAGKTGTTDNGVDAWFNGLTPQLAASVWMGNPKGDSATYGMDYHTGWGGVIYGATYCAPTWKAFMGPAVSVTPPTPFPAYNDAQAPPGKFINVPGVIVSTPPATSQGQAPNNRRRT